MEKQNSNINKIEHFEDEVFFSYVNKLTGFKQNLNISRNEDSIVVKSNNQKFTFTNTVCKQCSLDPNSATENWYINWTEDLVEKSIDKIAHLPNQVFIDYAKKIISSKSKPSNIQVVREKNVIKAISNRYMFEFTNTVCKCIPTTKDIDEEDWFINWTSDLDLETEDPEEVM